MINELDDLDRQILNLLQANGNLSNLELARRIDLSPPATHARVRRPEGDGLIQGYAALVDREQAGYDLLCFIWVSMQVHQLDQVERFRDAIRQMPEVLECHHITGEYDYLLKVVLHNRKDLERFVVHQLTPTLGVGRIHTSLALAEVKSSTVIPI